MEEMNKAYATFEERDRIASLGGGVDKIEQHLCRIDRSCVVMGILCRKTESTAAGCTWN